MFERILVPLDGTPFAEHAVPTAIRLARASGGRLILARVFDAPPSIGEAQGYGVLDAQTLETLERTAREALDEATRRIAAHAGVPVEAACAAGAVPRTLHALAVERGADLIVLASHARGTLGRLLSGSVAERTARAPGVPVLVLRMSDAQLDGEGAADPAAAGDPTRGPAATLRHLLVPLDDSATAAGVLEPATALARATGAAVTIVTVHEALLEAARVPDHAARAEYLDDVARRLRDTGLAVDVREVADRNVADAIVRCTADVGADAIAMATHGRGAIGRLLKGGVAEAVTHAVLLPVLLIHPREADAAAALGANR